MHDQFGADADKNLASSLHLREEPVHRGDPVTVPVRRLDGVLAREAAAARRIALWIDVKGVAYEALA